MQVRERWLIIGLILIFLVLLTFPYIYAWFSADDVHVFGGFLFNPIDGNSYLAKMRQGYEGAWLFTLTYTAEPGPGTPLNLYYLFLGHFARALGLSLLFTFHVWRLVGAFFLALALTRFFVAVLDKSRTRLLALALSLFGSGMGWLAISFGMFSSDFWVAEAFPFLAGYANAHFPPGLALQIWLLTPLGRAKDFGRRQIVFTFGAAALLSLIYPFGWLVSISLLSLWLIWLAWRHAELAGEGRRWLSTAVGGGPYVLYQWWMVHNHPVLAQWNAQNLTPAPAPLDLALSLSPTLILALWGLYVALRGREPKMHFLAIWLLFGMALVYLPFNLQRRLLSGLCVPVAGLALLALQNLTQNWRRRAALGIALLVLALPTNLFILMGGLQAARLQDPVIYLERSELEAFSWLDEHALPNALVLASPQSGLFIPAYSQARVLYGHPFETVNAVEQRDAVTAFYADSLNSTEALDFLQRARVDYVLYGPREQIIGSLPELPGWQLVYEVNDVQIWAPTP